jgi:hypothetical protein
LLTQVQKNVVFELKKDTGLPNYSTVTKADCVHDINPLLLLEFADFFFVDTTPFQLKYWKHPGKDHYDWRGVAPRGKYIANLLKVHF